MPKSKSTTQEERRPAVDGGNWSQVIREAAAIMDEMDRLEQSRKAINQDLALQREELEKLGINRHAAKAARQYAKLDTKQRGDFDTSYVASREAVGLPVQGDLFEGAGPVPQPKPGLAAVT